MCGGITRALGACLSPDPSPGRLSGLVQCATVARDPVFFTETAGTRVTWSWPCSLLAVALWLLSRARQSCGQMPAPLQDGPRSPLLALVVGVLGCACTQPGAGFRPEASGEDPCCLSQVLAAAVSPGLTAVSLQLLPARGLLCLSVSTLCLSCFVRTLVIGFGAPWII